MSNYVVVDKEQLEADLTTVADAIRAKGGTSETLSFPFGMKDAVEAISSGGGSDEEFVGIKLSDFTGAYGLPKKADLISILDISHDDMFSYSAERFCNMFRNNNKNPNGGFYTQLEEVSLPKIYGFSSYMFSNCGKLTTINGDFTDVVSIGNNCFQQCASLENIPYMPNLEIIGTLCFQACTSLKSFKIYKTHTTIYNNAFSGCTNLLDIYVPWSEGEVENAPWGATNATIHYNTTYDENHNPIV